MSLTLDPSQAKLAAQIIKTQRSQLSEAKEKIASLSADVAKYTRQEECLKIAHRLSEIGRIPKDFESILEKAASIAESDKDLEVIKEAIDMSQTNFELGTVTGSKPSVGGMDPITEVLLSSL